MEENLAQILALNLEKIKSANDLKELDGLFLELFGKNGKVTLLPKDFSKLSKEELIKTGPLFNKLKIELEEAIEARRQEVREKGYQALEEEVLDLKKVDLKPRQGHLHPLSQFEDEIVDLFKKLGFEQFDAPQIDTDYYNFEVLNIPQQHPARDMWDTFYIETDQQLTINDKLLLRTHTSNSQLRILKNNQPPIRKMILGRCFRYENVDARHNHTFDQFEIVYVDKNVSMANLQYLSEVVLKSVFGQEIKARLRPKYYPFVEPGVGVDGLCMFCKGKGCKVCGGIGWLELAGAGMIHPIVLKNGGIDPNEYSGIAWGFGILRLVMLKHAIEDVRLLYDGDLNFLENLR